MRFSGCRIEKKQMSVHERHEKHEQSLKAFNCCLEKRVLPRRINFVVFVSFVDRFFHQGKC